MSILEETTPLETSKEIFFAKPNIIPNNFFSASRGNSATTTTTLPAMAREFIILLLSYELNYQPQKLDYYYRSAKKIQQMFHIPGWQLLLPNRKSLSISELRKNIILSANQFKLAIHKEEVKISSAQATALNKAYKNFLWE